MVDIENQSIEALTLANEGFRSRVFPVGPELQSPLLSGLSLKIRDIFDFLKTA